MNAKPTSDLPEPDRRFLDNFEACRIHAAQFAHREHLRVAYTYLSLHPFEEALDRMESGLLRLLAHLGAPPAKYHRTLTQSWLLAVRHFMDTAGPTTSFEQFLETGGSLLDQEIMGTHYTPDLLWSEEARCKFVEPDLLPIPPPRPR